MHGKLLQVYQWVDQFQCSSPKGCISEDFSDGGTELRSPSTRLQLLTTKHLMIARMEEIFVHLLPQSKIKNVCRSNDLYQKIKNWERINHQVMKPLNLFLSSQQIHDVAASVPGAIEMVLMRLRKRFLELKSGKLSPSAVPQRFQKNTGHNLRPVLPYQQTDQLNRHKQPQHHRYHDMDHSIDISVALLNVHMSQCENALQQHRPRKETNGEVSMDPQVARNPLIESCSVHLEPSLSLSDLVYAFSNDPRSAAYNSDDSRSTTSGSSRFVDGTERERKSVAMNEPESQPEQSHVKSIKRILPESKRHARRDDDREYHVTFESGELGIDLSFPDDDSQSMTILRVHPDSQASRAGICVGDVIQRCNGSFVSDFMGKDGSRHVLQDHQGPLTLELIHPESSRENNQKESLTSRVEGPMIQIIHRFEDSHPAKNTRVSLWGVLTNDTFCLYANRRKDQLDQEITLDDIIQIKPVQRSEQKSISMTLRGGATLSFELPQDDDDDDDRLQSHWVESIMEAIEEQKVRQQEAEYDQLYQLLY